MKPPLEAIRNRRKLIAIPHNRALRLLFLTKVNQTHVVVPSAKNLPEDVLVLGVHTDFMRGAFVYEIAHESFDEIPEGVVAPFIEVTLDVINLARPEPDPKPFPNPKDASKPSISLLSKLGSIAVHLDEVLSSDGHHFDKVALDQLLKDSEVRDWLKAMGPLVPVKRK